jgi:16S rRNA A1518/A1519 N6-dimethyltransferase RsmA/KsgA/DIM1 with predicted DNA glycosylase/AP lyase activity
MHLALPRIHYCTFLSLLCMMYGNLAILFMNTPDSFWGRRNVYSSHIKRIHIQMSVPDILYACNYVFCFCYTRTRKGNWNDLKPLRHVITGLNNQIFRVPILLRNWSSNFLNREKSCPLGHLVLRLRMHITRQAILPLPIRLDGALPI